MSHGPLNQKIDKISSVGMATEKAVGRNSIEGKNGKNTGVDPTSFCLPFPACHADMIKSIEVTGIKAIRKGKEIQKDVTKCNTPIYPVAVSNRQEMGACVACASARGGPCKNNFFDGIE
jgi:hypothetical protein